LNVQPADPLPQPSLWRKLLSGNRDHIAEAVAQITAAGLADDYAAMLLVVRRRNAQRTWNLLGMVSFTTNYGERARRSALTALGLLWGALGRELGLALDPRASNFDREHAHKALIRRRDQRAVRPLIDALLSGHALEDWQCIPTLGALGDLSAASALLQYIGLEGSGQVNEAVLDLGVDIGRALHELNARDSLKTVQDALENSASALSADQRSAAALVLAGWGDETLAPLILPLVNDSESRVRVAAITALGELKAWESLATLQENLNDPDETVKGAVERALQQVTKANAHRAVKTGKIKQASPIRK
jgi:HEAT repeat protein